MPRRRILRPHLAESLEARVVPAQGPAAAALPPVYGQVLTIPAPVAATPAIETAFSTFVSSYESAVRNVLLAIGPGGTIDVGANWGRFQASLDEALNTLADDVSQSLAGNSAGLAPVRQAILGNTDSSLRTQVLAQARTILDLAVLGLPIASPLENSTRAIRQVEAAVDTLVEQAAPPQPVPTPAPTLELSPIRAGSSNPVTTQESAGRAIREAYREFLEDYFRAAQRWLGPATPGDPAANRASFDALVAAALGRLDAQAAAIVAPFATKAEATTLHAAILGPEPASLQSRLAALPTPKDTPAPLEDTPGPELLAFRRQSFEIIGDSLALVTGNVYEILLGTPAAP